MRSERRNKFYLKLFSILFVIASIAFWRTGPEVLPEFLLSIAEAQDDAETEETESQAESVDSSPAKSAIGREPASAASPVQEQQSDAVSLLANEVKALKDMMMSMASSPSAPPGLPTMGASPTRPLEPVDRSPSAPMSALLQFANGTAPAGPISQTAARMQSELGVAEDGKAPPPPPMDTGPPPNQTAVPGQNPSWAAPMVPQGPPPAQPWSPPSVAPAFAGWAPCQGAAKTSAQAGELVAHLLHWTALRATNPYWGAHFWREVATMEQNVGLEADLLRVLRGAGYNGPSTIGPPRNNLKADLEALRDLGGPALGAGLAAAQAQMTAPTPVPFNGLENRWRSGLPPDLNRAAPEIYRALRSEGVNDVRECRISS